MSAVIFCDRTSDEALLHIDRVDPFGDNPSRILDCLLGRRRRITMTNVKVKFRRFLSGTKTIKVVSDRNNSL